MSYSSNMVRSMMGNYGMPGGPGFGAPGMNMAMPQMDPNMARQLALQRMQQQRQGPSPMPQQRPQMPPGMPQGAGLQQPPMNMAMPMQGQSFGPQDMNQVGAQGGMSPAMQNMRNLDFKGIQQAFNQGPQRTNGFANATSMQEIGRQMGFDPAAGDTAFARLSPEQQQRFKQSFGGGLMGIMGQGQQPSAAVGSDMGAGPAAAMANQQAMAQANQQAPAPTPRRNPYGMSMDMMARMNPNAARYYGGR